MAKTAYFNKIKLLLESDELLKTYVPTFDEFIKDPDKWLGELPGYGEDEFGGGDDAEDELDDFESDSDMDLGDDGQGEDEFGDDEFGDDFGDDEEGFDDNGQEEPTQEDSGDDFGDLGDEGQGQGEDEFGDFEDEGQGQEEGDDDLDI